MATVTLAQEHNSYIVYNRQVSTDSGWENPFRPGGDLSREADEIVELIKEGKPITPTPGSVSPKPPSEPSPQSPETTDGAVSNGKAAPGSPITKQVANDVAHSPKQQGTPQKNGGAAVGPVEVQRGTAVQPSDASQVEHVIIKKKPKCKCCVIQ